jgi:hypothetical protein
MSASGADLARNPGASEEPDTTAVPLDVRDCGQVLARRPPSAADTAAGL